MNARNTRLGYGLFFVYLLLYGGFVVVTAFAPGVMETVLGGVPLSVWYGFVLIIVAVVLAVIYGLMCRDDEATTQNEESH